MNSFDSRPSTSPSEVVHTSESKEAERKPTAVVTAQGSIYRYLPDGRTQRYKKAEEKEYPPMDLLVFVPDFAWVKKNAPPAILERFESNTQYEQDLLQGVQTKGSKSYIIDASGHKLETNQEVREAVKNGPIFFTFGKEGGVFTSIPVSPHPREGFYAYDSTRYPDDAEGNHLRERHLGNKVIEIRY